MWNMDWIRANCDIVPYHGVNWLELSLGVRANNMSLPAKTAFAPSTEPELGTTLVSMS